MFTFSPSVHVHDTWNAVETYIREVMNVDADQEPTGFEDYNLEALNNFIQGQHKAIDYQNNNKENKLH